MGIKNTMPQIKIKQKTRFEKWPIKQNNIQRYRQRKKEKLKLNLKFCEIFKGQHSLKRNYKLRTGKLEQSQITNTRT